MGLDNLRASEPCETDVRGTQVSLKNTLVSLKSNPVSLNSTQVSLNSSQVSLTIGIYVGGCSCLACLACFVHASHVCLTCLPRLPHWLAYCPHSQISHQAALTSFQTVQDLNETPCKYKINRLTGDCDQQQTSVTHQSSEAKKGW